MDSAVVLLVAPPNIPWLAEGLPPITLTPCPDGWREVHGGAVTECDPYPEGGVDSCDEGEAHFPGEPGCRPIGDACPTGDYAASVPSSGEVVYVKGDAPAGGDGSHAAPFAALSEVPWPELTASTTVALAKGTYSGTLPLEAGVVVIGACARETVLTGGSALAFAVVSVRAAGEAAEVHNLTIRGAAQRGAVVRRGRQLSLRGVLVDDVRATGIFGHGAGTQLTLTDVVVRGTEGTGVTAYQLGTGVYLEEGVQLEATRFIVERNRIAGIFATGGGSVATLTDAAVRDTLSHEVTGVEGRGIQVQLGARLDAARLLVSGNHLVGVIAVGPRSAALMTDVVVRDNESRPSDGAGGQGVSAVIGAELTATRMLLANNRDNAALIDGAGSRATFTDVVIRDTRPPANGEAVGRGISSQLGGHLEATRLLITRSSGVALFVAGAGGTASVTDTVIRDTTPYPNSEIGGRGVTVQDGGRFEASQMLVTNNHELGIIVMHEGSFADITDTVIRDIRPQVSNQDFGHGMQGQMQAVITGRRVAIERTIGAGVIALGGAHVDLTDISITEVALSECASTSCTEEQYGYGVGGFGGAMSLLRFQISGVPLCGVIVGPDEDGTGRGNLDLEGGVVSGSQIGACIQLDGYDIDRLTNAVRYQDNSRNLDTTMLTIPSLADAAEP